VLQTSKVEIHYIRQKQPLGLGHAIWSARKFIGDEPFAVLLGDDIVENDGDPGLLQLINQHEQVGKSVIGVKQVSDEDTQRYGIIDPVSVDGKLIEVNKFVEKPAAGTAPSNYAIMGRYVLT